MATLFKNSLASGVGTSEVTALTSASNARTTVIGLSLTNLTDSPITVSITIYDPAPDVTAYFIKNVEIPIQTSLRAINGGEKLILAPSSVVKIWSSDDSSLDFVMSYVEII